MGLKSWIPSIVFFVVMTLLYFFARTVYKVIHRILLVIFAISLIFILLVYMDAQEMQTKLPVEDKTFLLANGPELIAGFEVIGEESKFLNELNSESYLAGNLDVILGDNYKLLIFDYSIINNVNSVTIGEDTFTQNEVKTVLESENALKELKKIYAQKMGIEEEQSDTITLNGIESNQEAKALMFSTIAINTLNTEGIIQLLRSKKLKIYPETITFKFLQVLPDFLLNTKVSENEVKTLGTT